MNSTGIGYSLTDNNNGETLDQDNIQEINAFEPNNNAINHNNNLNEPQTVNIMPSALQDQPINPSQTQTAYPVQPTYPIQPTYQVQPAYPNAQLNMYGIPRHLSPDDSNNTLLNKQVQIPPYVSMLPSNKQQILYGPPIHTLQVYNAPANIIKVPENNDSIMVKYDGSTDNFTFFDYKNSPLGSFNINQLMRYFGIKWDNKFMQNIDSGTSMDVIHSLIGNVTIDKDTNRVIVKLKSYLDSPFMGDIEMLFKFNNAIRNFELNSLENELNKIESLKTRKYIRMTIKQFIYLILNHTLKIIATISEQIKNDSTKENLKNTLLKYSVGIVHRISSFVRDQLELNIIQLDKLNENTTKLNDVRQLIIKKFDSIGSTIDKQNDKINQMISQHGGSIATSSNSNTTSMTSSISNTSNVSISSSIKNSEKQAVSPDTSISKSISSKPSDTSISKTESGKLRSTETSINTSNKSSSVISELINKAKNTKQFSISSLFEDSDSENGFASENTDDSDIDSISSLKSVNSKKTDSDKSYSAIYNID
jgi:hypothetical protein